MVCALCQEISEVEAGGHPWAIAKLPTGYVWLNPTQYYPGATSFVSTACVAELHDLEPELRQLHLMEMAAVAAAVHRAARARKMNYEALGNGVPHLHWWLTPRSNDDPRPRGPIWEDFDFLRTLWTDSGRPPEEAGAASRQRILDELRYEEVVIQETYL